jgi:hypothetical protein
MTWAPWGIVVAAIILAGAVLGRVSIERTKPVGDRRDARLTRGHLVSAVAVVVMAAAALALTVAPPVKHGHLANTVPDPAPAYDLALGGNDTAFVSEYTVDSELPGFVGHAAYKGEVLLTWEPRHDFDDLLGPMGIFHNAFTWVSQTFPVLNLAGAQQIETTRAAQVLMMSVTGRDFARGVRSLARFRPVVVRRAILSRGSFHLYVWLVDLRRYLRRRSV